MQSSDEWWVAKQRPGRHFRSAKADNGARGGDVGAGG